MIFPIHVLTKKPCFKRKYCINSLGICEDLVNNEDLESVENLSAREKNVRKRQKRKLAKERDESSKKQKIAALAYR